MDDSAFCNQVADAAMADHAKVHGVSGPFRDVLAEALRRLRANGVTWTEIFTKIGQIVAIVVSGGGNWVAIITEILKLFAKSPTPADLTAPA